MKENKIISISSEINRPCKTDFEKLMRAAEDKINNISRSNPKTYYKMGATKLEKESAELIKSVCDGTIFNPNDVVLISGHAFPDIKASAHFGVEVKSTEGTTWTSTGSSIMENTRLPEIDSIYMLFGKLGSTPPEFRCRPYESVLKGISVTHSPRYTIDMTISGGETIFDQMGVSYDEFRKDPYKIDKVRAFYKKKNKKKGITNATQWWLGKESPVNLEIMRRGFDYERKKALIAEMLILFDELIDGEYGEAAAWLCTRKFIINPSFRDMFSAGGKVSGIDGKILKDTYPHIVGCILEHTPYIHECFKMNSPDLLEDIRTHWSINPQDKDLFSLWIKRVKKSFKRCEELRNINIEDLILTAPHSIKYS